MIGNVNYVCFDCRKSVKAMPHGEPGPHCPMCSGNMLDIGMHIQVPKRGDIKGWEKMHDEFFQRRKVNRLLMSLGGGFDSLDKLREVEKLRGRIL